MIIKKKIKKKKIIKKKIIERGTWWIIRLDEVRITVVAGIQNIIDCIDKLYLNDKRNSIWCIRCA